MARRPRPSYFRDPPLLVFGGRLKRLRTARGWSQGELAHRADRHFTHVSSVERGERNATLLTILGLAQALDLDPGVLLTEDEAAVSSAVAVLKKRRASDAPKRKKAPGDQLRKRSRKK